MVESSEEDAMIPRSYGLLELSLLLRLLLIVQEIRAERTDTEQPNRELG